MPAHNRAPELDHALRAAVLTISDRSAAGKREDLSGATIIEQLGEEGAQIVDRRILPDDRDLLRTALVELADRDQADVILTTGGTGLGPRDVTPETTLEVIDRRIPGIEEAMRRAGLAQTPYAMLSRAVCGMRRQTLIVNLPGGPQAVRECLSVILPVVRHAVAVARSPLVPDSSHRWNESEF